VGGYGRLVAGEVQVVVQLYLLHLIRVRVSVRVRVRVRVGVGVRVRVRVKVRARVRRLHLASPLAKVGGRGARGVARLRVADAGAHQL